MTAVHHQPPYFSPQSQMHSHGTLGYGGRSQCRCSAGPHAGAGRGLIIRAHTATLYRSKSEAKRDEFSKAAFDSEQSRRQSPRRNENAQFSADQKQWYKMMIEIRTSGDAVPVLVRQRKAKRLTKESVIGTLVRLKQLRAWKSVMEICEWLMCQSWWEFGFEDYCLLMAAYGKDGQSLKAEALLEKFKDAGFKPSIAMHTGLIEAYVKKKMYDEAEYEFRRLTKSGPAPTLPTYITLMKAYAQDGRSHDAERVFYSIKSGGERPDGRCYNLMIHAYGKAGMTDKAYQLYQEMRRLKLDVSVVTFNTLISCQTSLRDAQGIFRQMNAANVVPDAFTYTTLMNGCGKAGKTEEAQVLFDEMVACGIRPTRTTYNVLLDAYGKACQVYEAEVVMKKMRKDKFTPTIRSFTTLVHAYALSGNMEKAEEILRRMKSEKVLPNEFTLSAIMAGYAAAKDTEKMVKRFTEMKAGGLRPNQAAYTVMIEAWGLQDDFESSKHWFQEMVASGCEVDSRAKSALINASKSPEQLQEATRMIENCALGQLSAKQ